LNNDTFKKLFGKKEEDEKNKDKKGVHAKSGTH